MTQKKGAQIFDLRRGGVIIHTSAGVIQYGASPETIKDTMQLECGVPEIFLLPKNLFLEDLGISMADLEFPIYYNFFVRGRKIRVICDAGQRSRAATVIREAIFGPHDLASLALDYPEGAASFGFPDFARELAYFRRNPRTGRPMSLNDLVTFLEYDAAGEVRIGDVTVSNREVDWFVIRDKGEELAFIPSQIYILPQAPAVEPGPPFSPPHFGLTVIGSGHGFDPKEMTSGFLLWVNKHGILVDPPVNTTAWLKSNRIDPKHVSTIIITHCHADHDAGSLQKILDEGRITVVTTRTILESFSRKYRALLDLPRARFAQLFDFMPVRIGEPISLYGGHFLFKYSLHSIPTVMFEVAFAGKSLVYSADHMNDPAFFATLREAGVLNAGRHEDLLKFPWDRDLILHEAGTPPIHTPMAVLEALPPETKARIRLIHVSAAAVKPESGLAVATKGVEGTHVFQVAEPKMSLALQMLDVLSRIDLFRTLQISRAKEFLEIVKVERYPQGELIIRQGTPGDKFYIILDGVAGVTVDGKTDVKHYGRNDYFGEISILLDRPRTADVFARTDLACLVLDKADFIKFMRETPIVERFRRAAENRALNSWDLFDESDVLGPLSGTQRTEFLSILLPVSFRRGERIAAEGERAVHAWLIDRGRVEVASRERDVRTAGRGELVGFVPRRRIARVHAATLKAATRVSAFAIPVADFARFLNNNPGILVHFEKTTLLD